MVVRHAVSQVTAGLIALGLGVALSGEAFAQYNVLKECGSQYQAAKAANELGGQNWQDFLKACRTRLQEQGQAPAAEAKPAEAAKPADTAKPAEAAKPAPTEAPKAAETKPAETAPPAAEAPALNPLKPPAAAAEKPKDERAAMRERQKACAAEWKEKKKELIAADKKLTWPKFWSACNKRLKEGGQ